MSECTESERFAAFLRSLKERSGLSYAALATKAGTSGSSVHRYCLGSSVPQDYGTVHRLAVACGATPEELRTLHRLWALADAAREPDPTATTGPDTPPTGPRTSPTEARAARPEPETARPEPGSGRPEPLAARPEPEAARPERGAAEAGPEPDGVQPEAEPDAAGSEPGSEPEPGSARAGSGREPEAVQPEAVRPAPGADASGAGHRAGALRSRRRRTRAGMTVGLAVLLLGGMAWTLPSLGPADGDGGGPDKSTSARQKTDGRTLFTPACREVVAMGQHDACVREVQRLLEAKGAVIGVDGDFGPQTLRRVTAFQVIAGIEPPNGVVGDRTKRALYESGARMDTWTPDEVRRRIREVFTEAPDRAVAIADCQSFLDPLHILPNTNGTRNWGLFQISDARLRELKGTPRKALDPEWNIRAAKRLWSRHRDFGDWPHCDRAFKPSPSPSR